MFKRRRADLNASFACACDFGDELIVRTFVNMLGMDPGRKQLFGPSRDTLALPALWAAQQGHVAAVRELIKYSSQVSGPRARSP